MKHSKLNKIYQRALNIFESDELTWEEKYDLIFSDEISLKVKLNYYDPDMGYEDDIRAFMNAFEEHVRIQNISNNF